LENATDVDAARSSTDLLLGAQVQPAAGSASASSLRLARAGTMLAEKGGRASTSLGAVINASAPCSQGGSLTMNGNMAAGMGGASGMGGMAGTGSRGNIFSVGDTATLTASACREMMDGIPTTLSGSMTIAITGGSFDPGAGFPRRVVMLIHASSFGVAAAGDSSSISGDMNVDLTEHSASSSTLVLTGSSLSTRLATSTGTRSFTMHDYREVLTVSGATTSYACTGDFETSNGRLGAGPMRYHASMPTPLVASGTGDFSAGSLRVDGKGSALLLTVTGTNTFQLQVDTNGDGTFDSTTTVTLAELRALH